MPIELHFFSRQLRPNERIYSTFDRELLGLYLAVRHFRFLLEGGSFTAYVDHKPLTFAMVKVVLRHCVISCFPAAGGCRSPELAPLLAQLVIYINTAKIAVLQLKHPHLPNPTLWCFSDSVSSHLRVTGLFCL